MNNKELIMKLCNLRTALYVLYKNYKSIESRVEFDNFFWGISIPPSYHIDDFKWLKYCSTPLPYEFKDGRFEVLKNFLEGYRVTRINENDVRLKKAKWYKLLFCWVDVPKYGGEPLKDLHKFVNKNNFVGNDCDFSVLDFHYYSFYNVNTLENELKILDYIKDNPKCEINKELKLSSSKINRYKVRIIEQLEQSKRLLEHRKEDLKKYYDYFLPRSNQMIEEDDEMFDILNILFDHLTKECDIVDQHNWDKIDGIIYMLSNGMANSIEGTLQFYNSWLYSDAIKKTLSTINQITLEKLKGFKTNMNRCFNDLFGNIEIPESMIQRIVNQLVNISDLEKFTTNIINKNIQDAKNSIKVERQDNSYYL